MDKYRLLAHKDEIFQMVKKAPIVEIGEIWQTLPLKREVYKIKKLEVLKDAMIFSTALNFGFDNMFPIYIKINFKNLIFKLMPGEFKIYNNQLSCTYPKEAKAIESRGLNRIKLPRKNNINLLLRTFSADQVIDIKVNIDDVSESGLGIKVNAMMAEHFTRNRSFKIIKVCGHNHMEEGTLMVLHVSAKDSNSYMFIGMHSDRNFSDEFFGILREEIKRERFGRISSLD